MKYFPKVFLSALLLFNWSCEQYDCGGFQQSYSDITGVMAVNLRLKNDTYANPDTLTNGSTIQYSYYGLKISPQADYYTHEQKQLHYGFFPVAYACSPPEPQPSEEIADIAVFSNAAYIQAESTKILAAGDTLNAVFEIYDYHSGRIVGLPDFLVDEGLKASEYGFVLKPIVEPASTQTHQFTIHYRLTNGEFYTFTAAPIILTP